MVRLLIALAIVGLTYYFLVFQKEEKIADKKPEVIYHQSVDKVRGAQDQVMKQAQKEREEIDRETK